MTSVNMTSQGKRGSKSAGPKPRVPKTTEGVVNAPAGPMATPSKAYAGPTFHASPAPSALPLPNFLSRSVPNAIKVSKIEHEEDGSDSEPPDSPSKRPIFEKSPLDILFHADRRSKATNFRAPHPGQSSSKPPACRDDIFAMDPEFRSPLSSHAQIAHSTPPQRFVYRPSTEPRPLPHNTQPPQIASTVSPDLRNAYLHAPQSPPRFPHDQHRHIGSPHRVSHPNRHKSSPSTTHIRPRPANMTSCLPSLGPQTGAQNRRPEPFKEDVCFSPKITNGLPSPRPQVPSKTTNTLPSSRPQDKPSLKLMEDDLRRLLKLDA